MNHTYRFLKWQTPFCFLKMNIIYRLNQLTLNQFGAIALGNIT